MYFKSNTHVQSLSYNNFIPPRNLIYYVGGPCSSGKTYHACAFYVAPSNQLAGQTAADLRKKRRYQKQQNLLAGSLL